MESALRRLRPSGAREGMVKHRRSGRRYSGGAMSGAVTRSPGTIPADVLRVQSEVSAPGVSAWVAANAGSGKTHVLAQRVINLLLEGVAPEKILCITFTKAAAANMAKRVFDTLGKWTKLDDDELDKAVTGSGIATG